MQPNLSPLAAQLHELIFLYDQIHSIGTKTSKQERDDKAILNVFVGMNKNGTFFIEEKKKGFFAMLGRGIEQIIRGKTYDPVKSFNQLKKQFNAVDRVGSDALNKALEELHSKGMDMTIQNASTSLDKFRDTMHDITSHVYDSRPKSAIYSQAAKAWSEPGQGGVLSLDLELVGNTPEERTINLCKRYGYALERSMRIEASSNKECRMLLEVIVGKKFTNSDFIRGQDANIRSLDAQMTNALRTQFKDDEKLRSYLEFFNQLLSRAAYVHER